MQGFNYYIDTAVQVPGPVPATAAQFADAITQQDGTVEPFVVPELDRYLNAQPQAFAYPDTAVRDNSQSALSDMSTDLRDGLVNDLQRRYDEAIGRYNNDPSLENQREVDELKRQLDLQKLDNFDDATERAKDDEPLPESSPDSLKQFDWSKWAQLKGVLQNTWPFSLLSSIPDYLSGLIVPPTAPTFNLPVFGGNSITVSLSIFDPVATLCRWLVGVLITVGGIQAVVRFWRGA